MKLKKYPMRLKSHESLNLGTKVTELYAYRLVCKTDEIEQTGLFGEVTYRSYRWDAEYDTATYLNLLNTYSGHLSLDSIKRAHFFDAIAELIDTKFNGHITKGYLTTLYVAQRL